MDIRNERRSVVVGDRAASVIARPGNVNCPHCGGKLGEVVLDPRLFHVGEGGTSDVVAAAEYLETFAEGSAAERARIRKELLAEVTRLTEPLRENGQSWELLVDAAALHAALDRIIPEEE